MTSERMQQQRNLLLEPDGLLVPVGSRIAYIFEGPSERARFAPTIAAGINENDLCLIVSDSVGGSMFRGALHGLGLDVSRHEREGSLVIIDGEAASGQIEASIRQAMKAAKNFHSVRCINDASRIGKEGLPAHDLLHFEVRLHSLAKANSCTIICQYDIASTAWSLNPVIVSHEFTYVSSRVERNPDRRPRSQIIFESMGEQLRVLTRLQDLSLKLTATLSLDETLDAIIESAITICRADCAAASCIDAKGELRLMRHIGLSEDYISRRQLSRNDPMVAKMMASKRPLIIEDVETMRNLSPNHAAWQQEGIRSIVTLPLLSGGEMLGVIGAGSRARRSYNETEINAMAILAAQASGAIANARLFEKLREANQAKDEFLATLSHELRTPLTPILGWMHLLAPLGESNPVLAQGLEAIDRNARQQSGLINDLLDLTRIINGKIELVREPTNLNALVRAAVEQALPLAKSRRVSLQASVPEETIINSVDPVRVQQAVSNILQNAVKFTPEEGTVSISMARDEQSNEAVIKVSDTGVGIDPEFLPQVFERFAQAHGGINRRFGGLGLGLAITRAMVEMHGGKVTADSRGVGYGSTFTIRLPIIADEANDEDLFAPSADEGLEQLGLNVLLIEDSRDTLNMLKMWLDSFGCRVQMATDGQEGIRMASEHPPDLIISDIGMPEIDGYEVIQKIRKTVGLDRVPAIALTGYAREEDRDLALAAGYDAHIAKPADMRRLLYLIKKLVRGESRSPRP